MIRRSVVFFLFCVVGPEQLDDLEQRPVDGDSCLTSSLTTICQALACLNFASLVTVLSVRCLTKRAFRTLKVDDLKRYRTRFCVKYLDL